MVLENKTDYEKWVSENGWRVSRDYDDLGNQSSFYIEEDNDDPPAGVFGIKISPMFDSMEQLRQWCDTIRDALEEQLTHSSPSKAITDEEIIKHWYGISTRTNRYDAEQDIVRLVRRFLKEAQKCEQERQNALCRRFGMAISDMFAGKKHQLLPDIIYQTYTENQQQAEQRGFKSGQRVPKCPCGKDAAIVYCISHFENIEMSLKKEGRVATLRELMEVIKNTRFIHRDSEMTDTIYEERMKQDNRIRGKVLLMLEARLREADQG